MLATHTKQANTPSQTSPSRLVLIDGMRGLAAIAVMFFHFGTVRGGHFWPFGHAYLAVDLFFILSGFVLARTFEPRLVGDLSPMDFMKLRIRRLWPAIALGNIGGMAAMYLQVHSPNVIIAYVMAVLMIPVFIQGKMLYPINPVQWSLAFELLANLVHACLLRKLPVRFLTLFWAMCGTIFAVQIMMTKSADFGGAGDDFAYGFARVGFSYTTGILLARTWAGNAQAHSRRQTGAWLLWLTAPVAAIALLDLVDEGSAALAEAITVLLVLPGLFAMACRAIPPARADKWLTALGQISYPLYAVHYPILMLVVWVHMNWLPEVPVVLANAAADIASIAFAHIAGRSIERFPKRSGLKRVPAIA